MTVARYSQPCQVGMYVISPTIFSPGAAAEKSRFTRSGIGPASPCRVVDGRHGRGWQATRPSSRISLRTSSGPAGTPQRPGDPSVAVRGIGIIEDLLDDQREFLPPFRGSAFRP